MKERYTKTKWVDGKTCVNAANLNKIESGIENLYRNAVGESQLQEGEGISLNKDPMTGNITIGIKAENDLVSSSAVGRIEVVESMPAEPDPNCMYFVKDLDTGKFDLVFGGINLLSTISTAEVPLAKLEGEVEVIDNGDGTFSVSYDGEEGTPRIVVSINGNMIDDPEDFTLIPGLNTIVVYIYIDGYEEKIVDGYEIEYTPITATPEITYDPETYTITVIGDGEIKFYIDGNLTELSEEGQYTFERGSEEITHTLTATAQEENCTISEIATLEITIPALPELEGTGEISIDAEEGYSRILIITYNGNEPDVEISVEGEGVEVINDIPMPIPQRGRSLVTKKIQLPEELGPHSFVVTLTAPGYQPWIYETSWELRRKLATPTISFEEKVVNGEEGVQVNIVSNDTTGYHLSASVYIGEIPASSWFIPKTYSKQIIYASAWNIADNSVPYYDSSDSVSGSFTLEAKEKTPSQSAEFSFTLTVDGLKAEFDATGPGVMLFSKESEESILRPLEFDRPALGEEDITIPAHTYYAETKESGEQYKETITWYDEAIVIPAQEESTPASTNIIYEEDYYGIWFSGNVIELYDRGGNRIENIPTEENPYLVNRESENTTVLFIVKTKDNYCIPKETTLEVPILAIGTQAEAPTITFHRTEEDEILTQVEVEVTGSTSYNITLNGTGTDSLIFNASYDTAQSIQVIAVNAPGEGYAPVTVEDSITIPRLLREFSGTASINVTEDGLATLEYETNDPNAEVEVTLDENPIQIEFVNGTGTYEITKNSVPGQYSNVLIITISPSEGYRGEDITEDYTFEYVIPKYSVSAPIINSEEEEDQVVVSIEWPESDGTRIYTGEESYERDDSDHSYEVEAYIEEGELYAESEHATVTIQVPAYEDPYTPDPDEPNIPENLDFSGNILCSEPTQEGTVTISYDGDEQVAITFSVVLNGQGTVLGENNTLQLQEGNNIIGVTILAEGYNSKLANFERTWDPLTLNG